MRRRSPKVCALRAGEIRSSSPSLESRPCAKCSRNRSATRSRSASETRIRSSIVLPALYFRVLLVLAWFVCFGEDPVELAAGLLQQPFRGPDLLGRAGVGDLPHPPAAPGPPGGPARDLPLLPLGRPPPRPPTPPPQWPGPFRPPDFRSHGPPRQWPPDMDRPPRRTWPSRSLAHLNISDRPGSMSPGPQAAAAIIRLSALLAIGSRYIDRIESGSGEVKL